VAIDEREGRTNSEKEDPIMGSGLRGEEEKGGVDKKRGGGILLSKKGGGEMGNISKESAKALATDYYQGSHRKKSLGERKEVPSSKKNVPTIFSKKGHQRPSKNEKAKGGKKKKFQPPFTPC